MESWREQYLGVETMPASLTLTEISFFFAPTERTRTFIESRRRPLTRLGLILHIGFLRMTGRPLAAFERVPPSVLTFTAEHAGLPAPQIGTLRAIYRRRMTLFDHQRLAAEAIAFQSAGDGTLRMLTAFLRKQAETDLNREDLMQQARRWLYDRCYMLPGERVLERMAARAQDYVLVELKAAMETAIGTDFTRDWTAQLTGPGPIAGEALLDWLRAPAQGFGRNDIGSMQSRIEHLRQLGAERIILPALPIERMRKHAVRIARRRAATLSRLTEPRRTVEIGCCLRLQLLDATDAILMQTSRRIGQLWSQARNTVEERALDELSHYRSGLGLVIGALDDGALSDAEFRGAVSRAVLPLRLLPATKGKVAAIRVQNGSGAGSLTLIDEAGLHIAARDPQGSPAQIRAIYPCCQICEPRKGIDGMGGGAFFTLPLGSGHLNRKSGGQARGLRGGDGHVAETLAAERIGQRST